VVGKRVVGVDISVLFHSLFGDKTEVRQILSVNQEASVFYFVGQRLNKWFKDRQLYHAKAIIFVHDPKLANQFHCGSCKKKYKEDIAIKYKVSGRDATTANNKVHFQTWIKERDEFLSLDEHERNANEVESLRRCFHNKVVKKSNVVTQALHNAFITWVHQYNIDVENAKILQNDHKTKGKKASTTTTEQATWPTMVCVNSPVEADDQLGYFHECGLVEVILTVDSDLIALGCFDIVTKGLTSPNKQAVPRGYTTKTVMDRGMKLFAIDKNERDWRVKNIKSQLEYIRTLFCFLSCIVGNDYVKTAFKPKSRESTATSTDTIYAENVVADFAKRVGRNHLDSSLAKTLAAEVWTSVQQRSTPKQQAAKTGILRYGTSDKYIAAFQRAFMIYRSGRRWEFAGGIVPDIESFLRRECHLVSAGMGECDGTFVETSTMFITTTGEYEPRMIKDIDFNEYPVEALPLHVLRWWLLTRGIEVRREHSHDYVMIRAKAAANIPVIDPMLYKTTWSNLLQSMIGTTPRIAAVHWEGTPTKWMISPDKKTPQNVEPLLLGLALCDLKVQERKLLASNRMTKKESMKSKRMSRDGQVMWSKFTMLKGSINLKGNIVAAVQFKLQCIPSMKSDVYPVNLVFVAGATRQFREDLSLSFCYCKAGAVTSSVCSHRMAVRRWLSQLQKKWMKDPETNFVNFYEVAKKLGVPPSIFHVSQLPIHVEPTFNKIRHTASTQSDNWLANIETELNLDNDEYLKSALAPEMETRCKNYCRAILRRFMGQR